MSKSLGVVLFLGFLAALTLQHFTQTYASEVTKENKRLKMEIRALSMLTNRPAIDLALEHKSGDVYVMVNKNQRTIKRFPAVCPPTQKL